MRNLQKLSKKMVAPIIAVLAVDACADAASTATEADDASLTVSRCTATTALEEAVCASEAFIDTLTPDQKVTVLTDWTDSVAKTRWSNLPTIGRGALPPGLPYPRSGLMFADLSEESRAAVMSLARTVLSGAGYEDMQGVLAADDYLIPFNDSAAPVGFDFGSGLYFIAFIGAPSRTAPWMLQITGHHLAWNVTFLDGAAYPTPNHIGVEPKGKFELDSRTYAPLDDEALAMTSVFKSLDATQLGSAYLRDQVFADLLLGPDEYETGRYDNVLYPTGAGRTGIVVSTLNSEQQALVTAAIAGWVEDVAPAISQPLMAEYTSPAAYADTLIAWGGTESEGVNVDVDNTYMRIDGPRVWIELSCQPVIILQQSGGTHYHSVYRDKARDYGNLLR